MGILAPVIVVSKPVLSNREFSECLSSPKVQDQNSRVDLMRLSAILESGHLVRIGELEGTKFE